MVFFTQEGNACVKYNASAFDDKEGLYSSSWLSLTSLLYVLWFINIGFHWGKHMMHMYEVCVDWGSRVIDLLVGTIDVL